ncbi:unnamed protein product, partial [Ectocarpus sp. 6 AP-2014]
DEAVGQQDEAVGRSISSAPLYAPPALLPLVLSLKAMPSYNRDLKSFAGEGSNNNVPMEDPIFVPTLEAGTDPPFLVFLTKLSLVTRFGHARAPPSPPPVKEISRSR